MGCSPWFFTAFRHRDSLRHVIEILISKLNFHVLGYFIGQILTEGFLMFLADDQHDLVKSGFMRVVNREVNDRFAIAAESVYLLQPAVAAAHTGCQND